MKKCSINEKFIVDVDESFMRELPNQCIYSKSDTIQSL